MALSAPNIAGPGSLVGVGLFFVFTAIVAKDSSGSPLGRTANRVLLGLVGALCIVAAGAWTTYNQYEKVFRASDPELTIEPAQYRGPCPARVQFTGTLHTHGGTGGTVAYRVIRQSPKGTNVEGSSWMTKSSKAAGDVPINFPYETKQSIPPSYGLIRVYSPQTKDSTAVPFQIECTRHAH